MSYYQVCANFMLLGSRPSLVSLSLHSTSEYYPFLVGSHASNLSISRYFRSLNLAKQYIAYLYSRYPNSTAPMPVLDPLQLLLF